MNICNHYPKCDLPQKSKATVAINNTNICYDAWNRATTEERSWIKKATDMYNRGLTTRQEFSDAMLQICYHHTDQTLPVHV